MAYYVLDANKNLKEALDKEGVYALLEQAIEDGSLDNVDEDSAFVSKIKDLNGGQNFKVWIGTSAEYNAIQEKVQNTLYLITDDNLDQELTDIEQQVDTLQTSVDDLATEHTTMDNRITSAENRITNVENGYLNLRTISYSLLLDTDRTKLRMLLLTETYVKVIFEYSHTDSGVIRNYKSDADVIFTDTGNSNNIYLRYYDFVTSTFQSINISNSMDRNVFVTYLSKN